MSDKDIYEAISEGVRRAFWDMITNDTMMPCVDFFESIKQGVKEAHEKLS